MDDLYVGSLFAGRFQIEALLGQGGMGVVYLARHVILESRVAVKVIVKDLVSRPDVAARFRREAKIASRIVNPHVTAVHDFGYTDDGRPFIVMEYVEGENLDVVFEREQPFTLPRTLGILLQIVEAMNAAHAAGVVHRDLKPQNVVLSPRPSQGDFVKVLDFGLAKVVDASTMTALSTQGVTFGTPEYMSPEQCADAQVDHRSDLYSFGVLAFKLLTGRLPFSGPILKVMTDHLNTDAPRPSTIVDVPPEVEEVVLRCLAKKPAGRYPDTSALYNELVALHQRFGAIRRRTSALEAVATTPSAFAGRLDPADEWTEDDTSLDELMGTSVDGPGEETTRDVLCELAISVRERGLGSPELSEIMAALITEEDRLIDADAEIRSLEQQRDVSEAAARRREVRLRLGMAHLERERENAGASRFDDPARTMPPAGVSGDDAEARLEGSVRALSWSLQRLASVYLSRVDSFNTRLAQLQDELAHARAAAEKLEERLRALLRRVRREQTRRLDAGLLDLFAAAGIE